MATWPISRSSTLGDLMKTESRGYLEVRKGHAAAMTVDAFDLSAAAKERPNEHDYTPDSHGRGIMNWLFELACDGICSGPGPTTETPGWPDLGNLLNQDAARSQMMPASPHPPRSYGDLHKHRIRYTLAGCTRHRAAVDRTSAWIADMDDS